MLKRIVAIAMLTLLLLACSRQVVERVLVADGMEGLAHFTVGYSHRNPPGEYEFECLLGSVRVAEAKSPHKTIQYGDGDIGTLQEGDSVTLAFCRAYQDRIRNRGLFGARWASR